MSTSSSPFRLHEALARIATTALGALVPIGCIQKKPTSLSLRAHLLTLVGAIAIPLVLVTAYSIYEETEQAIAEANATVRTLATVVAANTSQTLAGNRERLEILARRPRMRAVDEALCDPALADFHELFPHFANLTTIDLKGRAVCSAVPQPGGKPVNVFGTEWFQRALAEKRFLAGKPFRGPITGKWVSVLVAPIPAEHGEIRGFMGLPLDLSVFNPNIADVSMPADSRYGIVAGDGTMIWRNVDTDRVVGTNIGGTGVVKKLLSVRHGAFEEYGVDGIPRYFAVAPVPEADWYAYVGVPSQAIHAKAVSHAVRGSLLALAGMALLAVLAICLARRIEKPMQALAAAAHAVKGGDAGARAVPAGPQEVADVAVAFNAMVEAWSTTTRHLRASEVRYRRLFTDSKVPMLLIDTADDRILDANPAACAYYGYAPAVLKAMRIVDINTLSADEIHAEIELVRTGQKQRLQFRHRLANGDVRDVEVSSGPIEIDGRTALLSIVLDVTERKRAEREREQYFKFFNASSDLMGIADPNGAFKKVNPAFVKTLGYTEAELLAKPFVEFIHPDDRQLTLDEMARQLQRGFSLDFENRYVCKDGSPRWLSWRAEVNRDEGLTYATARDVTERHCAEEALHRSEERWKFALEGAGDGVWDWNVQAGEIAFSRRWKEMLGYAEDEIVDSFAAWEERLHPDDRARALARIQAYFDGTAPDYTLEHRLRCKDGSWKWILARGMAVSRTADGKPLRMIGTHTDISERKRMEAELREMATTDFLTGLYSRRHFMARMEEQLARVQRRVTELASVLMLDLDHFKRINDTYGHAAGDALLKHVAAVMREDLRKIDTAGRIGGEEFGIILPGSDAAAAAVFAERLRKRVADVPLQCDGKAIAITVSIGISEMTAEDTGVDAVLARADQALYRAKESGRNCVEIYRAEAATESPV